MSLKKIEDLEFIKVKIRDLGFWDFFDTFKKFHGLLLTHFRNFRE